jgi:glycosyltransferase involved in cell wall biosynthesis
MKTPRISVVMPAYNSERYIGEAIESILNQTFTDFEFIIINDGSMDDTAKIVLQYANKDKRIKFINNKDNRGIVSVLNQGLDLAKGEYIARMDSDDISLPTRLGIICTITTDTKCLFANGTTKVLNQRNTTKLLTKKNIKQYLCTVIMNKKNYPAINAGYFFNLFFLRFFVLLHRFGDAFYLQQLIFQ